MLMINYFWYRFFEKEYIENKEINGVLGNKWVIFEYFVFLLILFEREYLFFFVSV